LRDRSFDPKAAAIGPGRARLNIGKVSIAPSWTWMQLPGVTRDAYASSSFGICTIAEIKPAFSSWPTVLAMS
jgi:hypothetical protein